MNATPPTAHDAASRAAALVQHQERHVAFLQSRLKHPGRTLNDNQASRALKEFNDAKAELVRRQEALAAIQSEAAIGVQLALF